MIDQIAAAALLAAGLIGLAHFLWPEQPARYGYFVWRDGRFIRDRRVP